MNTMNMNQVGMNQLGMNLDLRMPLNMALPGIQGMQNLFPPAMPSSMQVGLHVDRIPIDTLNRDVTETIERHLGVQVINFEDKRGQKTVHCCAFAVVQGMVDFKGKNEILIDLPLAAGVRSVPGTVDCADQTAPKQVRVQRANRRPDAAISPPPRSTLHIRVMTQRRNWAFGVKNLTWVGLTSLLELASPGSTERMILVADDTSQKTSQAHPENFICGFFVEMADVPAAKELLESCGDRRIIIDRVPFRISTEYTRKDGLKLYDKPVSLREMKLNEFAQVRSASVEIANGVRHAVETIAVEFPFKNDFFSTPTSDSPLPRSKGLVEFFRFMESTDVKRLPKWYIQRLTELGWQPPGTILATDEILTGLLRSVRMEEYAPVLEDMGATSYLDLLMLDDSLLKEWGMTKVLHRRKLLEAIRNLKQRVVDPNTADPIATGGVVPTVQKPATTAATAAAPAATPQVQVQVPQQAAPLAQEDVGAAEVDIPAHFEEDDRKDNKTHNPAKMHAGRMARVTQITPSQFDEDDQWANPTRWTLPVCDKPSEIT